MRSALLAGLVLALAPVVGSAQTGPSYATVIDDGVKLRAGASDRLPVTVLRDGRKMELSLPTQ